jgi:hypothetical protein
VPFKAEDGGTDWARWCGLMELPFDEVEAHRLDAAANIEELPKDQCYRCIYETYQASFAKQRYETCDTVIKAYWKRREKDC